jgi:hypothetical protein
VSERKVSTEVHRQVWDCGEGVHIDVGPDGDGLDLVQLSIDGKSAEFFGPARIVMLPGMARAVGKALIAAAKDADALRLDGERGAA